MDEGAGFGPRQGSPRLTSVAVLVAVLWLATACTPPPQTFAAHGVSFAHPEGWRPIEVGSIRTSVGHPLSRDAVGIDGSNFVLVERYRVAISITDETFDRHRDALIQEWTQAVEHGGASVVGPVETIELDGLPGLRFGAAGVSGDGRPALSTMVLAFDGRTEYFVNCQRTEERAAEMEAGCEQVLDTFVVE